MNAHILRAEDDQRLAQLVSDFLTASGVEVTVEEQGHRVERTVEQMKPA